MVTRFTSSAALRDLDPWVARVARAGHLPPLLVPPDGQVRPVYAGGSPPLGAPSDVRGPHGRRARGAPDIREMAGPGRDDDMTLLVALHIGAPQPATVGQPARNGPQAAVLEVDG